MSATGPRSEKDPAIQVPVRTAYHRWLGWHASALRRLAAGGIVGVVVAAGSAPFTSWPLVVLAGWDASALTYVLGMAPIIVRTDGPSTEQLAMREDVNRDVARLILLVACAASLVAVSVALGLARHESGTERVLLVALATLTVVVSWTVVNLVFTVRYAHLFYGSRRRPAVVDFGAEAEAGRADQPDYRDFAYLAFTIGMTYQVSDTNLRDRGVRRTVLVHALLSYVFGVVIVAASVNAIAGLLG